MAPVRPRGWRRWAQRLAAGVVAADAAYASYDGQRRFALDHGSAGLPADLWPLSVDGLVVLVSSALLNPVMRSVQRRVRWAVCAAFGLGIVVSLVANIAAGQIRDMLIFSNLRALLVVSRGVTKISLKFVSLPWLGPPVAVAFGVLACGLSGPLADAAPPTGFGAPRARLARLPALRRPIWHAGREGTGGRRTTRRRPEGRFLRAVGGSDGGSDE